MAVSHQATEICDCFDCWLSRRRAVGDADLQKAPSPPSGLLKESCACGHSVSGQSDRAVREAFDAHDAYEDARGCLEIRADR
jgi:hypothetical protein